ncbi:hypothetical protein KJ684_03495, partial [Patescibacteria group bacterium]|nr:hypothetical protein [Patescibacteria group bacterium]
MKRKVKINKSTFIILGIIVFCLILPNIVSAANLFDSMGKEIVYMVSDAIHAVLNFFVKAGAGFMDGMLDIGFDSNMNVVKKAWGTTRDIANMMFILFLVVVAFATILRNEQYGVKQLLPKIILIALLINFSFVIAATIVDFSNIASKLFINEIRTKTGEGGISGTFGDAMSLGETKMSVNCEEYVNKKIKECARWAAAGLIGAAINLNCQIKYANLKKTCEKNKEILVSDREGNFLNSIVSLTVGSLVMLIAAFTFFAGGIMLLIRIVVIWFLLMIVPLAFICYIMPALRKNWQDWWKTFLKWCFFAPIYTFFIWLAFIVATNGSNKQIATSIVDEVAKKSVGFDPYGSTFVINPAEQLISYGFIIALLIGGIIVSQKLGIYGANTAMNIAKKAKDGTLKWAGRTTMRPIKATGRLAGGKALTGAGNLFGNTRAGQRLRAKGAQIRQSGVEDAQNKKYQKLFSTMNNNDVLGEVNKASGSRKIIAIREAQRRGLFRNAERETVKKAMSSMRTFGAAEDASKLEETRFDAIDATKDKTARNKAIERSVNSGAYKNLGAKVFEGEIGIEVLQELEEQTTPGELRKTYKSWTKETKESVNNSLSSRFTANPDDKENKIRKTYASLTGQITNAFRGTAGENNTINITIDEGNKTQNIEIEKHIHGLDDEGIGRLKQEKGDLDILAKYIKGSQVSGAGTKLDATKKAYIKNKIEQDIRSGIQDANKEALEQINLSPSWGGKLNIGQQSTPSNQETSEQRKNEAVEEIK